MAEKKLDKVTVAYFENCALDEYNNQRDVLAHDIAKKINKKTIKNNLVEGLVAGTLIGTTFGIVAGQNMARVPVYDANEHVTEYKFDVKKMPQPLLNMLTFTILVALGLSGIKTATNLVSNRKHANKIASNTYFQYFEKPLNFHQTSPDMRSREKRAAALIINTLPATECARLQALALAGLKQNEDGQYYVDNTVIDAASQIISNFIRYNPNVAENISCIMHGRSPITYFLNRAKQRNK